MSEEVKQEGEFKLKTKPKRPKNLGKTEEVTKVQIPNTAPEAQGEVIPDVTKIEIKEKDAVQAQETNDSNVTVEEPKDSSDSEGVVEKIRTTKEEVESPLTLIEEDPAEQKVEEQKQVVEETKEVQQPAKQLPENIEKLVSFMEETGGTVEDYVRLNADYSNVDEKALLKEYYRKNKPHLDSEDVNLILEDFAWDSEVDEERDIRKKKIAFKEEVAKAKDYLEDLKQKYYDEIKMRPGVNQEQQKAMDFFNRYNKQQEQAEQLHEDFKLKTKKLFSEDFKGFDFQVGEKRYKYNIQNRDKVAENQSNINNLIGKFLDGDGNVVDPAGYHKAMYAAENVDKIANHFYEQGKADAVKDVVNKSKNLSNVKAREGNTGEVFVGGFKVKSISGSDSTKLKIKTKKFN